MRYHLFCCKGSRTIEALTIEDAIDLAVEMEQELQPAYGLECYPDDEGDPDWLFRVEDGQIYERG